MARPSNNMAVLLGLIKKPTKICLILLIACVAVLNCHQSIWGPYTDLADTVDDITAGRFKALQTVLGVLALYIVRYLVFQRFFNVARFLQRYIPWNRLLAALFLTAVVGFAGYLALDKVTKLFASRISSSEFEVNFDDIEDRNIFHPSFVKWPSGYEVSTFSPRYSSWGEPVIFYKAPWNEHIAHRRSGDILNEPVYQWDFFRRYPTEDVKLPCELFVEIPPEVDDILLETWWMVNSTLVHIDGEKISMTSRRGFVSRVPAKDEAPGTRLFFVKEPLCIRRLDARDFGDYACRAFIGFETPSHQSAAVPKETRMQLSKAVIVLGVRQRPPRQETVAVHPADSGFIYVIHRKLHESPDVVLIEHKVNGIPVHQLPCNDKCASELHWPFLDFSKQQSNRYLRTSDPEGHTVLIETHKFCVEQYNYGLHTFTVRRQFYNPITSRTDFVETEYYKSVLVVLQKSEFFSEVKDNAYSSVTLKDDCWQDDMPQASPYCHDQLTRGISTSRWHYTIDSWITMAIYLLSYVYYACWMYSMIRHSVNLTMPELLGETVVTTSRVELPLKEDGTEAPPKRSVQGDRVFQTQRDDYDVFLAYAPEDSAVCEQVKMILSGHDVKVYDSQHDVRPGQAQLTAWDLAMEYSHGFVVIVSRHYLAQPDLMLQFQIIHNLLLEQRVTEDRLLLLIAGKCRVPSALGPLPIIDLDLRHWQRQLEWWAFTLSGKFPHMSVLKQIGRDLHRDFRDVLDRSKRDDDVKQLLPGFPTLVRKLEALCGAVTQTTAIEGGASNPCGEQFIPQTTEPLLGHDPRTESSDSVSEADSDYDANRLGSAAYRATEGHIDLDASTYDVFLSYCEESSSDCAIARQLKEILERGLMTPEGAGEGEREREGERESAGLRVYDAVQDLPPGQAEVHVVSAAADSAAYVVLLSPAYCSDPLSRRLHFPQVLHAVFTDRVPLEHVLIVHTSGMFDLLGQDIKGREEGSEAECGNSDSVVLPEWFQAFTNIHWSPSVGLYEEDRLRMWIRRVVSGRN